MLMVEINLSGHRARQIGKREDMEEPTRDASLRAVSSPLQKSVLQPRQSKLAWSFLGVQRGTT